MRSCIRGYSTREELSGERGERGSGRVRVLRQTFCGMYVSRLAVVADASSLASQSY